MKNKQNSQTLSFAKLTVLAAGLWLSTGSAWAAKDSQDKQIKVQFDAGKSEKTYKGTIKGQGYDSYVFYAKEGQVLSPKFTKKGNAELILFDYGELDEPYVLPKTGQYDLRVIHPKAAAIRGDTSTYQLTIRIADKNSSKKKSSSSQTAAPAKGNYLCNGDKTLPVAFINDSKTPVAVIHYANELHVLKQAKSASGARYVSNGYELLTKGDEATLYKNDKAILSDCHL